MKRNIEKIIELPSGFQASFSGNEMSIKASGKESKKKFVIPAEIVVEGNKIKISAKNATKNVSKMIGTCEAHIKNMIEGLQKEFEYKLEVCNVHFPMTLKVEGSQLVIKNFLGETVDRKADITKDAKVEVKGNIILVKSLNKEAAGNTAANIEKATKIRNRDRRIFQDGIFIVERAGGKL